MLDMLINLIIIVVKLICFILNNQVFFTGNKSCLKSRRKLNVDVFSFKDSDNDQLPSGGLNKTRLK